MLTALDIRATARLLIVDDQAVNRHLLTGLLKKAGFIHLETAVDGREAVQAVERWDPDLVLMDLVMPVMDGFEACRHLRAAGFRELPILVQTALDNSEDRGRAFQNGATDYVTKPVHPPELLARVMLHLENRALLRDLHTYHEHRARELRVARSVHERIMPGPREIQRLSLQTGLDLQVHYEPCQELGGDFWDARLDPQGRIVVWLVDFSGHGITAALNTLRLNAVLRQVPLENFDPATHLNDINGRLKRSLPTGHFATILVGVLDPARDVFTYASAGAPSPVLQLPGAQDASLLPAGGLPAGITMLARYVNRQVDMPLGACLLLASDGLTEARIHGEMLGEEGLLAQFTRAVPNGRPDLARFLTQLEAARPFADDVTAVLMQRSAPVGR